jgi:biopolymer transport protein ExbD
MARRKSRPAHAQIEMNLIPMIDVMFFLLVFFTLASRLSESEHVDMSLARVSAGASSRAVEETRYIINVLPDDNGGALGYLLNGTTYAASAEGVGQLALALADGYRLNPTLAVHLRADRSTHYMWVEPAMRAATTGARIAGGGALPRLNLVVEIPSGSGTHGS